MVEVQPMSSVDFEEPLSKAAHLVLKGEPIVAVVKDKVLFGCIDDRHINPNLKDPSSIKAGSAAVKTPMLRDVSDFLDVLNKFSMEHFKALPVVDPEKKPLGYVSRTDVAEEALARGMIPNIAVENIMETPPYTVDSGETLGTVKRLMRELAVHRLIVTEKGKVVGVVSTFDLAMFAEKPKRRQRKQFVKELKGVDDLRVKDFLRDSFVRVGPQELLPEVLKKMVSNKASHAVVVEEGKERPLGVLPLKSLFAFILKMNSPEPQIVISHMPEDAGWMHDEVKELLLAAVSKAEKMFDVGHIHVNVKEGKSVYKVDVTLELDARPYHFHAQDYELGVAFRKVADHIERVVAKMKDLEKSRRVDVEPYEESEYL